MSTRVIALAITALLSSACSLAPKYEPPPVQPVTEYKEAGEWMVAQPADAESRGAWWEAFGDPKLNELQERLRAGNQDLRVAIARFDQARAVARRARSDVYPTLDAGADARRARSSANAPFSDGTIATGND